MLFSSSCSRPSHPSTIATLHFISVLQCHPFSSNAYTQLPPDLALRAAPLGWCSSPAEVSFLALHGRMKARPLLRHNLHFTCCPSCPLSPSTATLLVLGPLSTTFLLTFAYIFRFFPTLITVRLHSHAPLAHHVSAFRSCSFPFTLASDHPSCITLCPSRFTEIV